MRFINKKKDRKVRMGRRFNHSWITVRKGETIDLPKDKGKRYGFEKVTNSIQNVTEGKIGDKKVETKQIDNKEYVSFWNDLLKIEGIGLKTAKDIVKIFKTEKELKQAISHDDELPFRDDVEEKLRKEYGK